jgi:hypothetical protein
MVRSAVSPDLFCPLLLVCWFSSTDFLGVCRCSAAGHEQDGIAFRRITPYLGKQRYFARFC